MKKRLKKLVIFLLVICAVLFIYNMEYGKDNKGTSEEHRDVLRTYSFKDYIEPYPTSELHNRNVDNSASSRERSTFIENDVVFYRENGEMFMDNYSNVTQFVKSPSKANTSALNVDSVSQDRFKSNYGLFRKVIDRKETKSSANDPVLNRREKENSVPTRLKTSEEIKQEFKRRQKVIELTCEKFNVEKDTISKISEKVTKADIGTRQDKKFIDHVSMSNFHLVRSASTMTCLLNKVASTSLAVSLLKADGRRIPEWNRGLSPHNAVAVLHPQTAAEFTFARKYFFKFLLVRHPFERLLSAYRDKVERADHWSLMLFRDHILTSLKSKAQPLKASQNLSTKPSEEGDESLKNVLSSSFYKNQTLADESYPNGEAPDLTIEYSQDLLGYAHALRNANYIRKTVVSKSDQKQSKGVTHSMVHDTHLLQTSDGDQNFISNIGTNRSQKPLRTKATNTIGRKWIDGDSKSEIKAKVSATEKQREANINNNLDNANKESDAGEKIVTLTEHNRNIITTNIPTFGDFLEYILLTNLTDETFTSHWSTYWERCSPCSISYDVIAKLETAEEDLRMVNERLFGLHKINESDWYNQSPASKSSKNGTLVYYYSQLDPGIIGRIYKYFELDFSLFEYNIMDVFRLAGHCVTSSCDEMKIYL